MSEKQFYSNILNIDDNLVDSITSVKQSDESVVVRIKLKVSNTKCIYCDGPIRIHGYSARKIHHATLLNRDCTILYQQRRFSCSNCGSTFSENNPFSSSGETLSFETKLNILKCLKHPEITYTYAAELCNVSKSTVTRIFDNHVDIPRKKLTKVISLDEHYFPQSDHDSLYLLLVMDFLTGTIIDVLPSRRKDHVTKYFSDIKYKTYDYSTHLSELNNVQYISIDLYENYRDIAKVYFPQAIICADSFHVLKHLTDAFRKIRLKCKQETEDPSIKYLLVKYSVVFNHVQKLDTEKKYYKALKKFGNLRDIRDFLFHKFPTLEVAYNLKEEYIYFNESNEKEKAAQNFDSIRQKFGDCGIEEYEEFYNLLGNWKTEIINSFSSVNGRRINNSYIESKNSILEKMIINANGFTNFKRFRNRIMYCLNKNDTYTL